METICEELNIIITDPDKPSSSKKDKGDQFDVTHVSDTSCPTTVCVLDEQEMDSDSSQEDSSPFCLDTEDLLRFV